MTAMGSWQIYQILDWLQVDHLQIDSLLLLQVDRFHKISEHNQSLLMSTMENRALHI